MKIKIMPILLVLILIIPFVAAAQTNPCGKGGVLGQCISQVYIWSIGLSGLLAVAVCVFGGYLVMTARGNGAQATRGKSFIYSSIIGMVLLLGAYIILNTINTDLTNFTTPDINKVGNPPPPPAPQPAPSGSDNLRD